MVAVPTPEHPAATGSATGTAARSACSSVDSRLSAARARARKLIAKRAVVAAAAGAVPLPGLDWAVDAALLSKLIPQINEEFGLNATQIARLPEHQRERVQTAIALVGGALLGKLITKNLIISLMKTVGVRLTAAQAAKFVPLAGQVASATLNYAALRWLGEQHIKDCMRVAEEVPEVILALPAPKA
jgi:uncharacterized protein (DUF697 family)